jgi:hypothetical protein
MAIIGRRRQEDDSSSAGLNQKLLRELSSAGDRTFAGAVEVEDRDGGTAKLYIWDGGLYAAQLDGYDPPVITRLRSSGAVIGERWAELSALGGVDQRDPRLGVLAADRGWISADALAVVHQEYVMASLGALLARPKLRVTLLKDEQTADFCTLPVPVEPLFGAVQRRARRLAGTWETLGVSGSPATVIPIRTGGEVPPRLSMSEFTTMTLAVDGERSLDAVAEAVGFTRAEAVHMAGLLVLAGVIRVESGADSAPGDRLLVPEAFGRAITPAPRRVRTGPLIASAKPAIPDPEPPTQATAVDEVAVEDEAAFEVVDAPAVDAPSVGAATVDEVGDSSEQVRQLRLEIATAEKAELEAVLAEALAAERDAVARTVSVRGRLRDAQATIDSLVGSSGSTPDAS